MTESILKVKLSELKIVTEKLIDAVKNEDYKIIDSLFIDRQRIINDIDKLKIDKEEFKLIAGDMGLMEDFSCLEKAVEEKREEIKEKFNDIKNAKVANKSYMNNAYKAINILNART